jgi:hypothetical protein
MTEAWWEHFLPEVRASLLSEALEEWKRETALERARRRWFKQSEQSDEQQGEVTDG